MWWRAASRTRAPSRRPESSTTRRSSSSARTSSIPTDARVLHELGVVFYDKRLFDKAEGFLVRAAEVATGAAKARAKYALGLTYEAKKDIAHAVAAYREAVALDPKLMDARRTLADAYATIGEHERAVEELTRLLEIERTNEQAAKNREVLVRALEEMRSRRLLGKTARELEQSALVQEGQLKRKGRVPEEVPGTEVVRWTRPLVELYVTTGEGGIIDAMTLVLTDPDRAAAEEDDAFRVTVIGDDGEARTTNLATAASITFLREALGCPMTQASALYARLLGGEADVKWGGARLSRGRPSAARQKPTDVRHGLSVARKGEGRARRVTPSAAARSSPSCPDPSPCPPRRGRRAGPRSCGRSRGRGRCPPPSS